MINAWNIPVDVPHVYVHITFTYIFVCTCGYTNIHTHMVMHTDIHTCMHRGYARTPRKYHPRVCYLYTCHRSMYACILHVCMYEYSIRMYIWKLRASSAKISSTWVISVFMSVWHTCIAVCMHEIACICTCMSMYVCTCIYIYVHMCMHTHIWIHVHTYIWHIYIITHKYNYMYMHVYVCMYMSKMRAKIWGGYG